MHHLQRIFQVLVTAVVLGCNTHEHTDDRESVEVLRHALETAESDTAKLRVLVALATELKAQQPDTAWALLQRAEAISARVGTTEIGKDADELHAELLMQKFDPAAEAYLRGVIEKNRKAKDRKRELNGMMMLASQFARASRPLPSDSLLRLVIRGARETGAKLLECQAHGLAVNVSHSIGQPDSSLMHADLGLDLIDSSMPAVLEAIYRGDRSAPLFTMGLTDSALAEIKRAEALHFANGDTTSALMALGMHAAYLLEVGEYTEVVALILGSEEMRERFSSPQSAAVDAYNLGDAYRRLNQPTKALKWLPVAQERAAQIGMIDLAAIAHSGQAVIWSSMDSAALGRVGLRPSTLLDTALKVFHATEEILAQTGRFQEYGIMQIAIGKLLMHHGRNGDEYFENAHRAYEAGNMPLGICEALEAKSLSAFEQGKYAVALGYQEQALELSKKGGWRDLQGRLLQGMSSIHAKLGRPDLALEDLQRSNVLTEAYRGDSVTQAVAGAEARLEYTRRQIVDSLNHQQAIVLEREAARSAVAQQRTRTNGMAIGGSILVAGVAGGFMLDRRRRRERFAKEAARLETKALRAQMDPHFIGNTLHAVNGYLLSNDPDTASSLLSRFSKWIRSTLESSRHEEVPLREDIEAMRTYLALEQLRTRNKFEFTIEISPDDSLLALRIPPLLVQPILENAIQHGMLPKDGVGHIRLTVQDKDDHLLITVEDDGVGRGVKSIDRTGVEGKTSLSTAITRERLQLLSERTGKRAEVRVIDLAQGTRVEIELPVPKA